MSQSNGTEFPELPPAPPSRVVGQGYSSNHPVPTVQSYKVTKAENEQQANDYAEIVARRHAEDEERQKRSEELRNQQLNEKTQGEPVEENRGQGNAVKSSEKTKDKLDPSAPANEKSRMMEQMNLNKGQCSPHARPRHMLMLSSQAYGSYLEG